MKTVELSAVVRTETGKKAARSARKSELIPANIYGGDKNQMVAVGAKEFGKIINSHHVYTVKLNIDGKFVDTIIKEVQFHPVTDKVLHVDFLEVTDKKKVTVALPINLFGHAEGVKQGGKLLQVVRKVRVHGFVKDMPESIDIDVTSLTLGKSIMVSDLSLDKLTVAESGSLVIATVKVTRVTRDAKPAEEAAASTGAAATGTAAEA